jgi:ABC-type multidrug transport system fused ATPase/permease subunit
VIDAVVHAISIHASHAPDRATPVIPLLWAAFRSPAVTATTVVVALVGIQFLLLALNSLLQALSQASQQLLSERVGIRVQVLIMEHAATLDLAFFEDAKSYDMLQRAQREALSRPLDMVGSAFSMLRSLLTFLTMIALLFGINPLLPAPIPQLLAGAVCFEHGGFRYQGAERAVLHHHLHLPPLLHRPPGRPHPGAGGWPPEGSNLPAMKKRASCWRTKASGSTTEMLVSL